MRYEDLKKGNMLRHRIKVARESREWFDRHGKIALIDLDPFGHRSKKFHVSLCDDLIMIEENPFSERRRGLTRKYLASMRAIWDEEVEALTKELEEL